MVLRQVWMVFSLMPVVRFFSVVSGYKPSSLERMVVFLWLSFVMFFIGRSFRFQWVKCQWCEVVLSLDMQRTGSSGLLGKGLWSLCSTAGGLGVVDRQTCIFIGCSGCNLMFLWLL